MSKKHLVIGDGHAHPNHHNDRAVWLGELIRDVQPDVVVDIGDSADMPSLSGYDKSSRAAVGRTYKADVEAHNDFQDKLWSTVKKAKKKLPRRIKCIGNHEQRIDRALDANHQLQGTVSYNDLRMEEWYDTVVPYTGGTPGSVSIDGITYAHYLVGGISGRPISGEHTAHSLLTKQHSSVVVGHNHLLDSCLRSRSDGTKIRALSVGCYFDYDSDWAGECNKLYWRGICILHQVEGGTYDLEEVSLERIKRTYATNTK